MKSEDVEAPEEPPPVLGSWGRLYGLVIGFLVLQIGLYWALSAWAS